MHVVHVLDLVVGLAVCKTVVEANEGRIEVKSELQKGTTFSVLLPSSP
ncbi:MAG: ATP-binding protein [Candidatus Sigynarchaeota archaeon]